MKAFVAVLTFAAPSAIAMLKNIIYKRRKLKKIFQISVDK